MLRFLKKIYKNIIVIEITNERNDFNKGLCELTKSTFYPIVIYERQYYDICLADSNLYKNFEFNEKIVSPTVLYEIPEIKFNGVKGN